MAQGEAAYHIRHQDRNISVMYECVNVGACAVL